MQLNELLSVGIIILLGLLGGKLSHRVKIPKVTGYMLTGLFFGPSVLGLISTGTLENIQLINDIALGLILFAIGGEIEWQHLKAMGRRVIYIALAESAGAFILVFGLTGLLTGDWGVAGVVGCIIKATAPGTSRPGARARRSDSKLPAPANTSRAAITAAVANTGSPSTRISFWMRTISTSMKPPPMAPK